MGKDNENLKERIAKEKAEEAAEARGKVEAKAREAKEAIADAQGLKNYTTQELLDRLPPEKRKVAEMIKGNPDASKLDGLDPNYHYVFANKNKINMQRKAGLGFEVVEDPDKKIAAGVDGLRSRLGTSIEMGDTILVRERMELKIIKDREKERRNKEEMGVAEANFEESANRAGVKPITGEEALRRGGDSAGVEVDPAKNYNKSQRRQPTVHFAKRR